MGLYHSPKIVTTDLELVVDYDNSKSNKTSFWNNLITGANSQANPSWANGLTAFTCISVIHVVGFDTAYAYNPISKWNDGTTNASFVLYHFQNFQGNNDQNRFMWYANGAGTWKNISGSFLSTPGNKYVIAIQYNSTSGGQMWANGVKQSARAGSGVLGSGTGNISILNPTNSDPIHRVNYCCMYDRELSDEEMIHMYQVLKNRLV